MKKKISLMLIALLAILMLCACGKDPKTVDYNGKSYDDLAQESINYVYSTYVIVYSSDQYDDDEKLLEDAKSYGFTDIHFEGYKAWANLESLYGKCTQISATDDGVDFASQELLNTFKVTKAGNTLTTDVTLTFGEKNVIYELVYDYYDMSITSVTINPVQTMGEKMKSAGQNTIISLAIVFGVLILISLIIKGFVIFPKIEEKKKNKAKAIEAAKTAQAPVNDAPVVSTPVEEVNLMDDLELVAVITAAIAASEGTSTSGFVVRSINRR